MTAVEAFAQTQVPRDYIGTWVLRIVENGETQEGSLTFRADTWTFITPDQDMMTAEIVSCKAITNEDTNSKQNFPNGILMSIRQTQTGNIVSMQVFLHRDKKQVIMPDFLGFDMEFAFIKQ
jgi:hypothetical protein